MHRVISLTDTMSSDKILTEYFLMFQEHVGLEAVNDAIFLESTIYRLLKYSIRDKPYYINIIELFHEVS